MAAWGFLIFSMRNSPNLETALLWERWLVPLGALAAVVFYHFSASFNGFSARKWILRLAYPYSLLLIIPTFANVFVSAMQLKSYGYAPVYTPWIAIWMATGINRARVPTLFMKAESTVPRTVRAAMETVGPDEDGIRRLVNTSMAPVVCKLRLSTRTQATVTTAG